MMNAPGNVVLVEYRGGSADVTVGKSLMDIVYKCVLEKAPVECWGTKEHLAVMRELQWRVNAVVERIEAAALAEEG